MKNLIQNPWVIAVLAGFLYFGSTGGALMLSAPRWLPVPAEPEIGARHPYEVEAMLGFSSLAMEQLAAQLEWRKAKLDAREAELDSVAGVLESEREQLERARKNLEGQEERLHRLIHVWKETESAQLKKLSTIYSDMEPSMVVKVLNQFEDEKVVKILQLMGRDAVKEIFETMLAGVDQAGGDPAMRVAQLSQQLSRTFTQEQINPDPDE